MVETTKASTSCTTSTTTIGSCSGRLLDLADLDTYLISLLSPDLTDVLHWARRTQTAIAATIWNTQTNHNNNDAHTSTPSSTSSSWLPLEDLLALATIWASNGQTPGATALGIARVSEPQTQTQTHRSNQPVSFWKWLLGSLRSSSKSTYRQKLFLYALLRIVLPRLYERLRSKGLEYIQNETNNNSSLEPPKEDQRQQPLRFRLQSPATEPPPHLGGNDDRTPNTNDELAALAVHRRAVVAKTVLFWLDRVVLPSMRLALLLACWTGHDEGHGGDLALWWSGLSYQPLSALPQQQQQPPQAAAIVPLYVLFAHRRWIQRESMELLWNRIGRSLLGLGAEISDLRSAVGSSLRNEWRMWVLKWSYRRRFLSRKIQGMLARNNINNKNTTDDDDAGSDTDRIKTLGTRYNNDETMAQPCPLCETDSILVPYRLSECCGQVVCYTCLWERLASTQASSSSVAPKTTFVCPICYQDIQKCEPV